MYVLICRLSSSSSSYYNSSIRNKVNQRVLIICREIDKEAEYLLCNKWKKEGIRIYICSATNLLPKCLMCLLERWQSRSCGNELSPNVLTVRSWLQILQVLNYIRRCTTLWEAFRLLKLILTPSPYSVTSNWSGIRMSIYAVRPHKFTANILFTWTYLLPNQKTIASAFYLSPYPFSLGRATGK